jgi:hypothetical protein
MMNNNKILTVSYGTFSCTLEGFEDSFGTMKAIAEYFRDLAADDRYFGAEPPQPDADMLARIAQREVSRKVSARQHEGKIVLSALEDQREAAPEAPIAEAPAPVTAEAPAAPQVDVSSLIAPSPAPENLSLSLESDAAPISLEEPEATTEIALTEEPVEEAEEEVAVEEVAEEELTVEEAPIEEEATIEESQVEAAPEAAPEEVAEAEEDDLAPEAEAESFFAESPSAEVETEEEIEEPLAAAPAFEEPRAEAPAPRTGGQSIAEKLQRIRAVVAKTQAEAEKAEAEDYLEDEHAVAADGAESRTEPEMAEEEMPEAAQSRHDLAALLDAVQEEEEDETPEAEVAEAPAREGRLVKMKRADLEAAVARGALEEDQDETAAAEEETAEQAVPALDEIAPAKTDRSTLSPEKEAELARELAALEADIEAELAEDEADEETDWESAEAETAEEPAETDAEAAEAEADDAEEADTAEAAPAAPLRRRPEEARRLPDLEEKAGSDMDRLLAEADHKMDEPEGANRRDAFAHLRAAVAAKKADVAMGKPEREARSDDAYRSDLAEVVRPRRPEGAPRRPRPTEGRPAPLKLVAEQRIDGGRPANAGPVRPRRVAAVRPEVGSDDGSFADYAQEMGATSLPQLLEAAASYMSFVEGLEQFSRPQLMTKVRQAGAEGEFSREDGLRSFGQLLRAGKIEKIKGGRFTVSDEIGFRPDQRAAG